jgi:AcrR family transcriptional regulator
MKEDIISKAMEMFLAYGFKSVTMDDLAQEMGISKKTIYAHFDNKTQLVEEGALFVYEKISKGIEEILALHKNPIEELYDIKKFVMAYLKNEHTAPHYQLHKYYPKVYQMLQNKQFDVMQECVVDNIRRGIEQGIYRENLNVGFVARIYFAGGSIIKDQNLFPIEKFPIARLMDDYLEYHLRGIVTPEGRKILNSIINSNHE